MTYEIFICSDKDEEKLYRDQYESLLANAETVIVGDVEYPASKVQGRRMSRAFITGEVLVRYPSVTHAVDQAMALNVGDKWPIVLNVDYALNQTMGLIAEIISVARWNWVKQS